MNLTTRALLSVGALAVVAGAAFIGAKEAAVAVLAALPRVLRAGNSPIMASGGSMTFRSAVPWVCDTAVKTLHQRCITKDKVGIGTITWDNVLPEDPMNHVRTLGWSGLSTSWDLTISARGNNGKYGVMICTTGTKDINSAKCDPAGSAGSMNYLLLTLKLPQGDARKLALIDSKVVDTENGKSVTAVQYYDGDCVIHGPDQSGKSYTVDECEHPGRVETSLDSVKYHCQHGACQIGIDQ